MIFLLGLLSLMALVSCSDTGDTDGQTCNFPVVLETVPGGGDNVFLCGDGTIIECPDASCAFGGGTTSAGDPNSGNTRDDSTTIINPTPTPRRRGG